MSADDPLILGDDGADLEAALKYEISRTVLGRAIVGVSCQKGTDEDPGENVTTVTIDLHDGGALRMNLSPDGVTLYIHDPRDKEDWRKPLTGAVQ